MRESFVEDTQLTLLAGKEWTKAAKRTSFYTSWVKPTIDFVFALCALLTCAPILLTASALIALESRGNPLFRQKRVGVSGRYFEIYKLRTMYTATEHISAVTLDGDNRVTKLGGFLRDTKIDELPQLLNILRGEMSLIGPRPLSKEEYELVNQSGFREEHPGFCPQVRPGLTGLEQINRVQKLSYAERFSFNYEYECNQSWRLDMDIFRRTLLPCQFVCYAAGLGAILEFALVNGLCPF